MFFKKSALNDIAVGKDQGRIREAGEDDVGIGGEEDDQSSVHSDLRSLGDSSGTAC